MLEEAEHAVRARPVVIAMAVIFAEDAGGRSADLGLRLEPAGGDAPLKLYEPCPHAFHGFDALGALEGGPLLGVDDEHPHAWLLGDHLLNHCLGRLSLLACGDAAAARDPRSGRALDIVEHFAATPAIATNNVAVPTATQIIEVLARHHAAVADEHDALEAEARFEIAHNLCDRLGVAPVAGKDVMGDRPAVDHDETNQHLPVARLAVAAVTMGAEIGRPLALKLGRG